MSYRPGRHVKPVYAFPLNSHSSVTQIFYLSIPADRRLHDTTSYHGSLWSSVLDLMEQSKGFQRLYWGRSLEQPENVQLHVVRDRIWHHEDFLKKQKTRVNALLEPLSSGDSANPIRAVRHVTLAEQTPDCKALGRGAPFTGTAIYLRPTAAWDEGAWPLWTHTVRHVDGCLGCAGGTFLEPVELLGEPVLFGEVASKGAEGAGLMVPGDPSGASNPAGGVKGECEGYIVYVGWESVEKHEAYHHTKHFADHRVILRSGNNGYAEYGHIVFQGGREKVRDVDGAKL